jgi:hypothetical protein
MSATLPSGRYGTSAVWDGTNAYIFGGSDGSNRLNEIVRYNPSLDQVTLMSAVLPSGNSGASAIWNGTYAYIFGGYDGTIWLNQIVKYSPTLGTVESMSETLPSGRSLTSAIWNGTYAYIFGGGTQTIFSNQILRYGPNTPPNTPTTPSGPTSGFSGTSYTYSVSSTDPDDDQLKYVIDWGDGTQTTTSFGPSGWTATEAHTWSAPNTYYIKAMAIDDGGAISAWSSSLTVVISAPDTTKPSVSISSPAQNQWVTSSSVNVEWSGSDDESGIDYYEVRLDSGSWINTGTSTSYTFNNVDDGAHTATVGAYDKAGNDQEDTVSFGVDITKPSVSMSSPSSGTTITSSSVTASWSGSDATSGVDYYEVRLDGGSYVNVGLDTTYTFTGVGDGPHTITIKIDDKAGNYEETTTDFAVDTKAGGDGLSLLWSWLPYIIVILILVFIVVAIIVVVKKKY